MGWIKWLLAGVAFFLGILFWGWYFLAMLAFLVIVLFPLIIWFWLAPSDRFFTFVQESTAKAVMKAEELERIIFRWRGHFMDEEDNIWEEEDWEVSPKGIRKGKAGAQFARKTVKEQKVKGKIFGGLFWIGVYPFYKIHKYSLRWTDFRQTEEAGKEVFKLQFHEEEDRKFVMLKPAVYGIELQGVETRPPERIAVNVQIPITMRVINPRNFLFVAPPTPLEDVLVRISTLMRQRITMSIIDELLTLQGQAEKIWKGWRVTDEAKGILGVENIIGAKDEKLITDTLPKWGLRVAEKGIEMKSIEPPPDIQRAMAEKRKQEMQAEARAEEVMGALVASEAVARGKTKKEIQKEIDQDLSRRNDIWSTSKDLIWKKIATENRSYTMIEPVGVSGIDASILSFIAAGRKMPGGKGDGEGEKEPKKEKIKPDYSPEGKRKANQEVGEVIKQIKKDLGL